MTTRPGSRRAALALVLVLLVGLAGCGSDDTDDGAADGTPTTATAGDGDGDSSDAAADGDGGSDADAGSDAGGGDLCRLLTSEEAADALGGPVGPGQSSTQETPVGTAGGCNYIGQGGDPTANGLVNVILGATTMTREQFDAILGEDAPDAVEVDGPGEVNLLVQEGLLAVFDDGVDLNVQLVLPGGAPGATDALVAIATTALERLG